jgi:hypothetical protein
MFYFVKYKKVEKYWVHSTTRKGTEFRDCLALLWGFPRECKSKSKNQRASESSIWPVLPLVGRRRRYHVRKSVCIPEHGQGSMLALHREWVIANNLEVDRQHKQGSQTSTFQNFQKDKTD